MLEPYAAVVIYDEGDAQTGEGAAYIVLAHNLTKHDAYRLVHRLDVQYQLDASVVLHINQHTLTPASECQLCRSLFDAILASAMAGDAA